MSNRLKKVNSVISLEVSKLLSDEFSAPELGLITVTHVDTTADLHYADIWVSVVAEDTNESFKALSDIAPKMQRILNDRLRMKYVPKITFRLDRGEENAERIEQLLKQIRSE